MEPLEKIMATKEKENLLKIAQGYKESPLFPMCWNCIHFDSEFKEMALEKNIHCALGGFAVKRTANCNKHKFSEPF